MRDLRKKRRDRTKSVEIKSNGTYFTVPHDLIFVQHHLKIVVESHGRLEHANFAIHGG